MVNLIFVLKKCFFFSGSPCACAALREKKYRIEIAIGFASPDDEHNPESFMRHGNRLLFVGRCINLKGMAFGLQIFARILQLQHNVTVIGGGVEKTRWMDSAKHLGVDDSIEWRDWLPKADVQKLYSEFDVFFFPSLRDSGGFVVLEALEQGLPVVCFKIGGPGMLVEDTYGKAVHADSDFSENHFRLYRSSTRYIVTRNE